MGVLAFDNSARHRPESDAKNIALTPPWLVERIRVDVFGGAIDLDPATTSENPVGATRFVCLPEDGIFADWSGRVYCNPPYGGTLPHWIDRAKRARDDGATVVLLVPARTETRWFQAALASATDTLLFSRRLKFSASSTVRGTVNAPFPNALFGFGISLAPLADLGTIVRPCASTPATRLGIIATTPHASGVSS